MELVSSGRPGYATLEDELEEHRRTREYNRRRILYAIRGRLRQDKGLRWWFVSLIAGCALLSWGIAQGLHAAGHFRWFWLPGLGVMGSWPIYVLALWRRAKREGGKLDGEQGWETLKAADVEGEISDRETTELVDDALGTGWRCMRNTYNAETRFSELVVMAVASAVVSVIWDLLTMGPTLLAEMILDGVIIPASPAMEEQMPPGETWYKNALISTVMHFVSVAIIAMLVTAAIRIFYRTH